MSRTPPFPQIAKLTRPEVRGAYPRERLFARLDECRQASAAWISGMPGAGKTTLVASWLSTRRLPALWYRVDGGDADPATLAHFLNQAVAVATGLPPEALPAWTRDPTADLKRLARGHFSDLFARIHPSRVVVFDNAQEVAGSAAFHTLAREAIRAAPPGFLLIFVSRALPPAALSRMRLSGLLSVLQPEELQLTEDEAIGIQRAAGQTDLAQMRRWHGLAQGWAAGLRILLEQARCPATARTRGVPAEREALFEALAQEIFDRQEAPMQAFLLRVSRLPRMRVDTARGLSGEPEADRFLEELARSCSFTHKLAGEPLAYEFHPLLRDFLHARALARFSRDETAALGRRAAALLEAEGDIESAAAILVEIDAVDDLARLVKLHAPELIAQGRYQQLTVWLHAVGEAGLDRDPWLRFWQGTAAAPFDPERARDRLEQAFAGFRQAGDGLGCVLSWSAIVESIALEWSDFSLLERWLDEAADLPGPETLPPQAAARYTGAMVSALVFWRPDHPDFDAWAERLMAIIPACPDAGLRVLLGCNLFIHHAILTGDQPRQDAVVRAIRPDDPEALDPLASILWDAIRACDAWLAGRMAEAGEALDHGRALARQSGVRVWNFILVCHEAYVSLTAGDVQRYQTILPRLRQALDRRREVDYSHFLYLSAHAAMLAGNPAEAEALLGEATEIALRKSGPDHWAMKWLAHAQALHALGCRAKAWSALRRGAEIAQRYHGRRLEFQAQLAEADFSLTEGREAEGLDALRRGLAIGAEQGLVNYTWFRPDMVARLCAQALRHGIEPDYASRLIRARQLLPPGPEVEDWPWAIKVHTLGRFSLTVDDQPVNAEGKARQKPLELLQALIAFGGRAVSHARFIEALWPEAESKAGRGALESTLHRLREILNHPDAIRFDAGRLSLDPQLCWVDVWALERQLSGIEAALHGTDLPPATLHAALQALDLYQGAFLEREERRPWAHPLRQRLASRLARVVTDLGEALERQRRWDESVRLYRRALERDPLAEPWYRALMRSLRAQGETAEALRAYCACREALTQQLHCWPSGETERLYLGLMREEEG